jgi:hypothetical protein
MNFFKKKKKQENAFDDTFIRLIQVAIQEKEVKDRIIKILSLEKDKRNFALRTWIREMKFKKAPEDFITAISYFLEDGVAEKALKIITGEEKIK